MLNRARILELVEMQDSLNKQTAGVDWKEKRYNWGLYAIMESAEAIDSLDYKHWKHDDIDIENVKVELVDVVHFVLSDFLQDDEDETIANAFYNAQNAYTPREEINTESLVYQFHGLIQSISLNSGLNQASLNLLWIIWGGLGMTREELYKAYMTKNILNSFRQANGYKDGSYKKLWVFNGAEVEDNVVAYALAKEIDVSEDFGNALKSALRNKYKSL